MKPDFAAILLTILVMHTVVDHLVQRNHQSKCKTEPGWGGRLAALGHGAEHGAAVLAGLLTLYLLGIVANPGYISAVAGATFVMLSHAFIDRRWPIVWWLEHTGSREFAQMTTPISGKYVADQAAHWAAAFVGALIIVVF